MNSGKKMNDHEISDEVMIIEEIFINDYDKMNLFLAFYDEIKMEFNKIFGYNEEWLGNLILYLKEINRYNTSVL